jgi:hypothetical protein
VGVLSLGYFFFTQKKGSSPIGETCKRAASASR